MTIREYFDFICETFDEDVAYEAEVEAYEAMQSDDDTAWDAWMAERPMIDFEAIDERTGEYVTTLWAWDMCGD